MQLNKIDEIVKDFENNFQKVRDFMKVDEELFEIVLSQLNSIEGQINNHVAADKIDKVIRSLNTIRYNGTVEKKLSIIYNQSVVLMASYFSHALEQIFTTLINEQYINKDSIPKEVQKEELKLTLNEIADLDYDLSDTIGKMIIKKEDLKFQDMKSTGRAFKKYLDINLEKDITTNTIIVALSLRHAMVHNGGIINEKIIEQTKNARPRLIQETMRIGQQILITKKEINSIGECMHKYLSDIVDQFNKKSYKSCEE